MRFLPLPLSRLGPVREGSAPTCPTADVGGVWPACVLGLLATGLVACQGATVDTADTEVDTDSGADTDVCVEHDEYAYCMELEAKACTDAVCGKGVPTCDFLYRGSGGEDLCTPGAERTVRVKRSDWEAWMDRCEDLGGYAVQVEVLEGYDLSCVDGIIVGCDFSPCP